MTTPRRIGDHVLNPLFGWPNPYTPRIRARLSTNVTVPVYAGRVGHLNNSKEIELGLPDVNKACHMPLFIMSNSDDPDAYAYGGNPSTDIAVWAAARPDATKPQLLCLPATGGLEVETTEFDTTATYNPGDALTATDSNTTAAGGQIVKTTAYAKPLCGVVSRGVRRNEQGKDVLALWPVWLPRNQA